MVESRYWLQTLGCPKNQVDSDKLEGRLAGQGYRRAAAASEADLVVINGDPASRIADMENVEIVFKDGVGYDSAALLRSVAGRYGQY